MSKLYGVALALIGAVAAIVSVATGWAAGSPVEVLYVAEPHSVTVSLITYNVDPTTAAAEQQGKPIMVGATNVDPVMVNGKLFLYVWNGTDVWVYATNQEGTPNSAALQHLTFNLPHPVTTFLADPNGKFAYAGMIWVGTGLNNYAAAVLLTIDQETGALANTNKAMARYGPDPYIALTGFQFGTSGKRLYASFFNNGPYTCDPGYDYYNVNQTNGQLGPLTYLIEVPADCGGTAAVAVSDQLTAEVNTCCGYGSGFMYITQTATGKTILCQAPTVIFCGDDAAYVKFDPTGQNVFFADADNHIIDIGYLDFATSQVQESGTGIENTPPIYFSPDSRLVYAVNPNDVGIYVFDATAGTLGAFNPVPNGGNVTVATATLP